MAGLEADAGTSFGFKGLIAPCIWARVCPCVGTAEGTIPRGLGGGSERQGKETCVPRGQSSAGSA